MKIRIVIDSEEISDRIRSFFYHLQTDTKTMLGIKNRGYYRQIEDSVFKEKGCPRCGSRHFMFVRESPNGICTGCINECQECGQWFDLVCDYDRW